jgi:hypothetical protein
MGTLKIRIGTIKANKYKRNISVENFSSFSSLCRKRIRQAYRTSGKNTLELMLSVPVRLIFSVLAKYLLVCLLAKYYLLVLGAAEWMASKNYGCFIIVYFTS